jgi:hypothetical protein
VGWWGLQDTFSPTMAYEGCRSVIVPTHLCAVGPIRVGIALVGVFYPSLLGTLTFRDSFAILSSSTHDRCTETHYRTNTLPTRDRLASEWPFSVKQASLSSALGVFGRCSLYLSPASPGGNLQFDWPPVLSVGVCVCACVICHETPQSYPEPTPQRVERSCSRLQEDGRRDDVRGYCKPAQPTLPPPSSSIPPCRV